jgi:hypothetical protein
MLCYKQLTMVDQTFRTAKSLFATRPIFHKVDEAIRDVATPGQRPALAFPTIIGGVAIVALSFWVTLAVIDNGMINVIKVIVDFINP